jgi:hypothetical protein
MPSLRCFKKFLTMKQYFLIWSDQLAQTDRATPNIMAFTREAIKRANKIMKENVAFENFMRGISLNNSHYSIGSHQDGEPDYES